MADNSNKNTNLILIIVGAIVIIAVIVFGISITQNSPEPTQYSDHSSQHDLDTHNHTHDSHVHSSNKQESPTIVESDKKKTLSEIITRAYTWAPILNQLYGQKAPELIITDITGKKHSLSDYQGKDVILVFWATWCMPCLQEIPHLIELRNRIGEDKLAILAISNEPLSRVKPFVERSKINYTVFAGVNRPPSPYNQLRGIPSSFFIDPQGKIKLITEGAISLNDIIGILNADE